MYLLNVQVNSHIIDILFPRLFQVSWAFWSMFPKYFAWRSAHQEITYVSYVFALDAIVKVQLKVINYSYIFLRCDRFFRLWPSLTYVWKIKEIKKIIIFFYDAKKNATSNLP